MGVLFNSLIPKIHIKTLAPFHNFEILSIEALAHFYEQKFVTCKDAYGENSANKTLQRVSKTWRHVVAVRNSTQMFFFYQLRFKNDSFISERDLATRKKTQLLFSQLLIG